MAAESASVDGVNSGAAAQSVLVVVNVASNETTVITRADLSKGVEQLASFGAELGGIESDHLVGYHAGRQIRRPLGDCGVGT